MPTLIEDRVEHIYAMVLALEKLMHRQMDVCDKALGVVQVEKQRLDALEEWMLAQLTELRRKGQS